MRRDGWEQRLNVVLEHARTQPYRLGEHDCFRLACRVVEALTGVDRWPEFAGYTTRREALALLARHGGSFEEAFDKLAGTRIEAAEVRRGDLVCMRTEDGEKHLGVATGVHAALLAEAGLVWLRTRDALCGWRVG